MIYTSVLHSLVLSNSKYSFVQQVFVSPTPAKHLTLTVVNIQKSEYETKSFQCSHNKSPYFTLVSMTSNNGSVSCEGSKKFLDWNLTKLEARSEDDGWTSLEVEQYSAFSKFIHFASKSNIKWNRYTVRCDVAFLQLGSDGSELPLTVLITMSFAFVVALIAMISIVSRLHCLFVA